MEELVLRTSFVCNSGDVEKGTDIGSSAVRLEVVEWQTISGEIDVLKQPRKYKESERNDLLYEQPE